MSDEFTKEDQAMLEAGDTSAQVQETQEAVETPETPEVIERAPEKSSEDLREQISNLNKALHGERATAREERERSRRLEETFQRFVERSAMPAKSEPVETPIPDPGDDIGGHLIAKTKSLEAKLASIDELISQEVRQRTIQQQQNDIMSAYMDKANEYMQTVPDFGDAYQVFVTSRIRDYELMGLPSNVAAEQAKRDEIAMAKMSMDAGVNPAERVYQLAKHRGYAPKAAQSAVTDAETVLAAAEAASSTRGMSNANTGGKLTLERLATLEGKAFEDGWKQLMGR